VVLCLVGTQSDITALLNHKKAELAARHAALQVHYVLHQGLANAFVFCFCPLLHVCGCFATVQAAAATEAKGQFWPA
jgi:hypothetical protein